MIGQINRLVLKNGNSFNFITIRNLWRIYLVTLNISTKAETLVEVDAKSIAPKSYNESKVKKPVITEIFQNMKTTL